MVFRRRFNPQGFFTELALLEQMVDANTPEELQQVLEAHAQQIVNRRTLDVLKDLRAQFLRAGESDMVIHTDILVRVIENALHKGIPQAIATERQIIETFSAATLAIIRAAPWELEDVVRQHAAALQIPEFLDRLRRLDRLIHREAGENEDEASQLARSMKIDYAKDAGERGIAFAEQRYKERYQAYLREHGSQFPV